MTQKNNTNTIIGVLILIIIILGGIIFYVSTNQNTPAVQQTIPTQTATSSPVTTSTTTATTSTTFNYDNSSWQTLSSSTTGITFKYPTTTQLATNYIQTVDWPPYISVSSNTFSCAASGTAVGPNGQTSMKTINGTEYCVTIQSEGAAGSVYTTYSYAFPQDGKTLTLNFTLRYPECENYPDPQLTACKNEEAALNIDALANAMTASVQYVRIISPAQPTKPIAPPTSPINLNSISPTSGPVGTTITISGNGFATENKVLFNGNVATANAQPSSSVNGNQIMTITIPSSIGPDCKANQACPMYAELITPNTYLVTIENANGTSNALSFVVTASQSQ